MKVVEPVIVYLLGPVEDGIDIDINMNINQHEDPHFYNDHHFYNPLPHYGPLPLNTLTTTHNNNHTQRRQLSFLPSYVEDVSAFRETSMSFATLAMLFTIMTCVLIVFMSCFYHNQKTSPLFASPRRHRLPRLVPPPLPVDGIFSWVSVLFVDHNGVWDVEI